MRRFLIAIYFCAVPSVSQADDICPLPALCMPESSKKPLSNAERQKRYEDADKAFSSFKNQTFLNIADLKTYQQNLPGLIGQYFIVAKNGQTKEVELQGFGEIATKEAKTEIKDAIVFSSVITTSWKAGLGLPFLNINVGSDEVAELTIQDVVAATEPSKITIDTINCNFPKSLPLVDDANNPIQYYFITGAAVTTVSSRKYSKNGGKGDGAFWVIKLSGEHYYSDEEKRKEPVIWVSKRKVKPVVDDQATVVDERATVCAAFDKKKEEKKEEKKCEGQVALADDVSKLSGLGAAPEKVPGIPELRSELNDDIPELQGKVFGLSERKK